MWGEDLRRALCIQGHQCLWIGIPRYSLCLEGGEWPINPKLRRAILERSGGLCEAVWDGKRCLSTGDARLHGITEGVRPPPNP